MHKQLIFLILLAACQGQEGHPVWIDPLPVEHECDIQTEVLAVGEAAEEILGFGAAEVLMDPGFRVILTYLEDLGPYTSEEVASFTVVGPITTVRAVRRPPNGSCLEGLLLEFQAELEFEIQGVGRPIVVHVPVWVVSSGPGSDERWLYAEELVVTDQVPNDIMSLVNAADAHDGLVVGALIALGGFPFGGGSFSWIGVYDRGETYAYVPVMSAKWKQR